MNVAIRIDGRASSGIAYRRMSPHSVRKDTSYEEVGGVVRGRRLTFVTVGYNWWLSGMWEALVGVADFHRPERRLGVSETDI